METKGLIRKKSLMSRDAVPETDRKEKSRIIVERVMGTAEYQKAEDILVYVNFRSEVETAGLIGQALEDGKRVYCPKVSGVEMDFYQIGSLEELIEGYMGIKEPRAGQERLFDLDYEMTQKRNVMMLMPGSAFDSRRNRIGYGKGYYDKYIKKHPGLRTIGVCFSCQIQESVPAEEYDRKPDVLITEMCIYQ